MITNFRIDFQNGNDGTVIIDRSFRRRRTLSGKMSDGEWTRFCDDVDRSLEPFASLKKDETQFIVSSVAASTAVVAFFFATCIHKLGIPITFAISAIIVVVLVLAIFKGMRTKWLEIIKDMEAVLLAESGKRSDVSFQHFRTVAVLLDGYIECSVTAPANIEMVPVAAHVGMPGLSVMEQGLSTAPANIEMVPVAVPVAGTPVQSTPLFSTLASADDGGAVGNTQRIAER
jgi:hypothetical protein